uniref:Ulp1 protease-like protein n=1 Tax=Oryza sativa subsp. japonica TaxID=39947 RepID=Q6K6H9_ORYSJ|nr:Ulp1 protease-like protein [Oryza sativa Japonica Group]BAD21981.1 Ulp1 protease-like protein [Oryza sativa Japonica Group]
MEGVPDKERQPSQVKGPRALSSENDSPTTRLKARERKFYSTLTKTPCLYGSTPRSTKVSTTNVDKAPRRLYAFSIAQERLLDLDKEYRMKRWRDESAISDLAGHGFEEEGYPVIDYESDL